MTGHVSPQGTHRPEDRGTHTTHDLHILAAANLVRVAMLSIEELLVAAFATAGDRAYA